MNLWFCAERRGRIAYEGRASAALCGKTRHRAQKPASVALCGKTRPDCLRGPCVCGLVWKDEAGLLTRALRLWPCVERRGRIAYDGPASVPLCGKTRPDCLRGPCVCGLVWKDEAGLLTRALRLCPCVERRGRIAYEGPASVALCGKTRPDCLRGPCVCALVWKDEAGLLTRALRLCPCVERRGRIAYEGPASVPLCGKTR